jgi:uncharacterized membrane protein
MSRKSVKTLRLTQLALLVALEAILFFTPLGLIVIPPISMTTMHIPVIIAAVLLGPGAGAVLGASFGLMSMAKASLAAVSPVDMLFSPFLSGRPLASLLMCVGCRILLGLAAGWAYMAFSRVIRRDALAIGLSAAVATLIHSLSVLGCLWLFFSALPLQAVFAAIISLNGVLELAAAVAICMAVCGPLKKALAARSAQ